MSTGFRRMRSGRMAATFEDSEASVLRDLFGQVVQLLDDSADRPVPPMPKRRIPGAVEDEVDDDLGQHLRELVGDLSPREISDDPALARLLPDAYRDDAEAAGDFRRYTESELRTGKIEAARTAASTLGKGGGRISLDAEQAGAWLGALNDLRLTLGARLEVTEDHETTFGELSDDDPRKQLWYVYDWLSFLQQSLVEALLK